MREKIQIQKRSGTMIRKAYKKRRFKRQFMRKLRRVCNDEFGLEVPMKRFCKKYRAN